MLGTVDLEYGALAVLIISNAALNAMGCHAGQGFYLSKPLDHAAMDDLLASCIQSGTGRQLPPSWRMTA